MSERENPIDIAVLHSGRAAELAPQSPLEILMDAEEGPARAGGWRGRVEALNAMLEWVFAAGPDPRVIARRVGWIKVAECGAGVLPRAALMEWGAAWDVEVEETWRGREEEIRRVLLRVAGRLSAPDREARWDGAALGDDGREAVRAVLDWLWAAAAGRPVDVVRRLYVAVKPLKPWLVGDMSLEALAVLGCDGGRATVSARVLRDFNGLIERHGGAVKAPFQKSGEAVANMARAQAGNRNRARKRGRRKSRTNKRTTKNK